MVESLNVLKLFAKNTFEQGRAITVARALGMHKRLLIQAYGIDFDLLIGFEQGFGSPSKSRRCQVARGWRHPQQNQLFHQALSVTEFLDGFLPQMLRKPLVAPQSGEHALRQILLHRSHLVGERTRNPPQCSRINTHFEISPDNSEQGTQGRYISQISSASS